MGKGSTYDYIITGTGCAGLSLAVQLAKSAALRKKKILLIDKAPKTENDRTWCFWEKGSGAFEEIVFRKWNKVWFHGQGIGELLDISPFSYKMIRGIDFYRYCQEYLRHHSDFEIIYQPVTSIRNEGEHAVVSTNDRSWKADFIFNSIPFQKPEPYGKTYHLLQHFMGWIIETADPVFNTTEATLMDFRTDQNKGTTFLYTMPFSPHQALVEYTLFSEMVLPDADYEEGLRSYLKDQLQINEYKILETEKGVIPMTNFRFKETDGRIIHMGTAGGKTKPSTGYTFRNIQIQVASIISSLEEKGHPMVKKKTGAGRFHLYDSILLNVLSNHVLEGMFIFSELFRKNKPQKILSFLDNETSLTEEFRLLNSLPQWPFMKAGMEEIIKAVRR